MRSGGVAAWLACVIAVGALGRHGRADDPTPAPPPVRRAVERAVLDLQKRGAPAEAAVCLEVLAALGHPAPEVERLRSKSATPSKGADPRGLAAAAAIVEKAAVAVGEHAAAAAGDEPKRLARLVLRLDDQHAGARRTLGHAQVAGVWLDPLGEAMATRRGEIARAVQAARRLAVTVRQGPGTHPVLAPAGGAAVTSYAAHGLTVISTQPAEKVSRIVREALRACALAHWAVGGTLAVPEEPLVYVCCDDAPAYRRALDQAHARGLISPENYTIGKQTAAFWTTEGHAVGYSPMESHTEAALVSFKLGRRPGWEAQPGLTAGIESWVDLTYLGVTRPGFAWTETTQGPGGGGHRGGTEARPAAEPAGADRATMLHLARAGIAGCRAWMAWLARRGEDPPFVQCLVDRTEKLEGNLLLKATMVVAYLIEIEPLARLLDGTAEAVASREVRVRAFEKVLGQPITAFEADWRRWLCPETAGGVRQRLSPPAAVAVPADARAALAHLEGIRRRAIPQIAAASWHAVLIEPELSDGCAAHARYLARHPAQAAAWPDAHEEYPDREGFTAAGARAGGAGVIAPGSTSAEQAIDGWMGTFYHRLPLLHPGLLRIGWGLEQGFAVLDCGSLVGGCPQVDLRVAWPPDGAKGVPLRFNPELPHPKPGEDQATWGYPVTLQVFANDTGDVPVVASLRLRRGGADGPIVDCWLSTPTAPTNPVLAPPDAYCLIPKVPLAGDTAYTTEARLEPGGEFRWSWRTGR